MTNNTLFLRVRDKYYKTVKYARSKVKIFPPEELKIVVNLVLEEIEREKK